ncbi:MAG: ABC transporter permease [Gammaproteobacteria bacterium]
MSGSLQRIAAMTTKELRQLGRDRLTFGMIVGMPLIQILIFGYSINFDVRHLDTGVVDYAHTSASRALIADLEATQVIRVTGRPGSPAELEQGIQRGQYSLGLYVPPDFERRRLEGGRPLVQVLVDGSEPTIESVMRGLTGIPLALRPAPAPRGTPRAVPQFEVRTLYNPEKRTPVQIVPALIGVILHMTMVIFTSIALVREREHGNLELLITTPLTPRELMLGKLIPYVFVGLLQTSIIIATGYWLFNVPIVGSLLDVYLASLLFIASTLTLGLVNSTLAKTQFQAVQLGIFTLMPSILLSGFMFPFDGMPVPAQWLARLLPLTHFTDLIRGIVLRGATVADMPMQAGALVAFFLVFLGVAVLRFKKRLD